MSRGKKERRKKGKKSFYVAGKRGKSCCHLAADVIVQDEVDVDVNVDVDDGVLFIIIVIVMQVE